MDDTVGFDGDKAAELGLLDLMKLDFANGNRLEYTQMLFVGPARAGRIDILEWLHATIYAKHAHVRFTAYEKAALAAIDGNQLVSLEWVMSHIERERWELFLVRAIEYGADEIVEALLTRYAIEPKVPDILTACNIGNMPLVVRMWRDDVMANALYSAIWDSIASGNVQLLNWLLAKFRAIDAKRALDMRAMPAAYRSGNAEMVDRCEDILADPTEAISYAFSAALNEGHAHLLERALAACDNDEAFGIADEYCDWSNAANANYGDALRLVAAKWPERMTAERWTQIAQGAASGKHMDLLNWVYGEAQCAIDWRSFAQHWVYSAPVLQWLHAGGILDNLSPHDLCGIAEQALCSNDLGSLEWCYASGRAEMRLGRNTRLPTSPSRGTTQWLATHERDLLVRMIAREKARCCEHSPRPTLLDHVRIVAPELLVSALSIGDDDDGDNNAQ